MVSFRKVRVSGFVGWLMWLFVHITFLTGFKNRLSAMFHWTGTFLAGGRAERTITLRQVMGRVAIDEAGGEALTRHVIATQEQKQQRRDDSSSGGAARTTGDADFGHGRGRAD